MRNTEKRRQIFLVPELRWQFCRNVGDEMTSARHVLIERRINVLVETAMKRRCYSVNASSASSFSFCSRGCQRAREIMAKRFQTARDPAFANYSTGYYDVYYEDHDMLTQLRFAEGLAGGHQSHAGSGDYGSPRYEPIIPENGHIAVFAVVVHRHLDVGPKSGQRASPGAQVAVGPT